MYPLNASVRLRLRDRSRLDSVEVYSSDTPLQWMSRLVVVQASLLSIPYEKYRLNLHHHSVWE